MVRREMPRRSVRTLVEPCARVRRNFIWAVADFGAGWVKALLFSDPVSFSQSRCHVTGRTGTGLRIAGHCRHSFEDSVASGTPHRGQPFAWSSGQT